MPVPAGQHLRILGHLWRYLLMLLQLLLLLPLLPPSVRLCSAQVAFLCAFSNLTSLLCIWRPLWMRLHPITACSIAADLHLFPLSGSLKSGLYRVP